ncbi:hypothetical protein [Sphingomonas mesophila]|uniref:hypothetical protein n=1 Tax=Sphingomonas mesophila TaxID=2303576 RepID=UPI000E571BD4|nr:hypothetical protein [Sphingomonas mesophila]
MAGRLAWILAGGAAIVAGMAVQGSNFIDFDDSRDGHSAVERKIERAAERERDARVSVVVDGERSAEIDADTVRALTEAVGELVEAEAELAIAETGDGAGEVAAAKGRRDEAKALVDDLKAKVAAQGKATAGRVENGPATRDRIREEVRDEVRAAIRNN